MTTYLFFATFLHAFFNEQKAVLITINEYGEAWPELVFLTLTCVFGTIAFIKHFKKVATTFKDEE